MFFIECESDERRKLSSLCSTYMNIYSNRKEEKDFDKFSASICIILCHLARELFGVWKPHPDIKFSDTKDTCIEPHR